MIRFIVFFVLIFVSFMSIVSPAFGLECSDSSTASGEVEIKITAPEQIDGEWVGSVFFTCADRAEPEPDSDADGIIDAEDNCFAIANSDQADIDGDGIGDVCDLDRDGDNVQNVGDNCQVTSNTDQIDIDKDGLGDVCDPDMDGDGFTNDADVCPAAFNPNQSAIYCGAAPAYEVDDTSPLPVLRLIPTDDQLTGFTAPGNGTTRDKSTGLVWMTNGECLSVMTWHQALTAAQTFSAGNSLECNVTDNSVAGDWRLPNVNELNTLTDYHYYGPAITPDNPITVPHRAAYWSSTTQAESVANAWRWESVDGHLRAPIKTSLLNVLLVRSARPQELDVLNLPPDAKGNIVLTKGNLLKPLLWTGLSKCYNEELALIDCAGTGQDGELQRGYQQRGIRYTNNGNGTVTDTISGIVWLRNASCAAPSTQFPIAALHVRALADGACDLSDLSSPGDWMYPTIYDLHDIINWAQSRPAIDADSPFVNVPTNRVWSSTIGQQLSYNTAWVRSIGSGVVSTDSSAPGGTEHWSWPIRIQPAGPVELPCVINDSVIECSGHGRAAQFALAAEPDPGFTGLVDDMPIVYVRVKSTPKQDVVVEATSAPTGFVTLRKWSILDDLPEADLLRDRFVGPSELVARQKIDGEWVETVIFSCLDGDPDNECFVIDPAVSFDGQRVAFSVLRGGLLRPDVLRLTSVKEGTTVTEYLDTPNQYFLYPEYAEILIADVSGLPGDVVISKPEQPPAAYNMGPRFLPQGGLVFTSDAADRYTAAIQGHSNRRYRVMQLYIMSPEFDSYKNVNPGAMGNSLHPYVMMDGRIAFTSWMVNSGHPYDTNNGSIGRPVVRNDFWVTATDSYGGTQHALLAHSIHTGVHPFRGDTIEQLTPHFLGQMSNGDWCVSSYYTLNNFGAGVINCFGLNDPLIEGVFPTVDKNMAFISSRAYTVAGKRSDLSMYLGNMTTKHWARTSDAGSLWHIPTSKYMGKLRDPHGLPDGNMMVTWMNGYCSKVSGATRIPVYSSRQETRSIEAAMSSDQPGCNAGIYRTTTIPSYVPPAIATEENPSDMIVVVDSPEYHEFMAVPLVPYKWIYGIKQPSVMLSEPSGAAGLCTWAASDIVSHEVSSQWGNEFGNPYPCAKQGCSMENNSDIVGIRFYEALPNTAADMPRNGAFGDLKTTNGFQQRVIGEARANADGSLRVALPCENPFTVAGYREDGHVTRVDQYVQSIRQGEQKTCAGGCHTHSESAPILPFADTMAATLPPVDLTATTPVSYEWFRDIQPLLIENCSDCHQGGPETNGSHFDRPGVAIGSSWWCLVFDMDQKCREPNKTELRTNKSNFTFEKPNLSAFVNRAFPAESLLMWYAENKRLDGRENSDRDGDLDYVPNAAHADLLTKEQSDIIARWLETGAFACNHGNEQLCANEEVE